MTAPVAPARAAILAEIRDLSFSYATLVESALREGKTVEEAERDAKARFAGMMFAEQRIGDGVRLIAQHAR
jgi:hypothetical protein